MLRWTFRILSGLIVLAAFVLVGALGYRAWRQQETARALAIATPNGIDEKSFVRLNGLDQWVTIRGEDRRNPVLLVISGGPGNTLVPLEALFRPWEKHFTVVQWDQRGAGRTLESNGTTGQGAMTLDQFTSDGVKLAEFLRFHLHKNRIVLLGASFGTVVGVRMAKARPEYFSAYVGTAQVVSSAEQEVIDYAAVLKKVRAANDADSVRALTRVGPPPYRSLDDILVERGIASRYDTEAERDFYPRAVQLVLFSPDTTLLDIYYMLRYGSFAARALIGEVERYDARKLGPDFGMPVFVFNGDHDVITPFALSRAWVGGLHAPQKAFVMLKGGGHNAMLTMPDVFLRELVARVRPLAIKD
ncbi:MAG TPA: alpha/beta hydrolase [Rhizomicrobium sp.]|nr:alpha/beta hydrolase [Rhizomicrobium sp.]